MVNLNMYFIFGIWCFNFLGYAGIWIHFMYDVCVFPLVYNSIYWELGLVMLIRQAKDVVKGIKKKIGSRNSKVQLLALTVSEGVH
jgi:hypothetical protein